MFICSCGTKRWLLSDWTKVEITRRVWTNGLQPSFRSIYNHLLLVLFIDESRAVWLSLRPFVVFAGEQPPSSMAPTVLKSPSKTLVIGSTGGSMITTGLASVRIQGNHTKCHQDNCCRLMPLTVVIAGGALTGVFSASIIRSVIIVRQIELFCSVLLPGAHEPPLVWKEPEGGDRCSRCVCRLWKHSEVWTRIW